MYYKFFQNVQKQSNISVQQNLELCYAQNICCFTKKYMLKFLSSHTL